MFLHPDAAQKESCRTLAPSTRHGLICGLLYSESHHTLVGRLTEVIGCFPARKVCSRAASTVAKDKGLARLSKMVTASEARFWKAYR